MKLNLISGPRNVSTALMYSFSRRPDMKVVDEPFYACYLHHTGIDHPGKDEVLTAQPIDPKDVIVHLQQVAKEAENLFIKNMAHHLGYVPVSFLGEAQNIFLIRDPREMILSFIKKIPNPTLQDTAYRQQHELFKHVSKNLNQSPLVIDAEELLKDPKAVLTSLCQKLGIPFDDDMLRWKTGAIPEDGVWAKHWYANVHASTGFKPYSPKEGRVPERLQPLLKKCRGYYSELYEHAIKV